MSSKRDEFSRARRGRRKQFQNTDCTSWLCILVSLGGFYFRSSSEIGVSRNGIANTLSRGCGA